jgi:hypothetical protein
MNTYTATRADLEATAKALFDVVLSGKVKIEINHTYSSMPSRCTETWSAARPPAPS